MLTNALLGVALAPDQATLATADGDGATRLWKLPGGARLSRLRPPGPRRVVRDVAFSPDGKTIATSALDGAVRVWDIGTGSITGSAEVDGAAASVAFGPDGSLLVAADDGVTLWAPSDAAVPAPELTA